MTVPRFSLILKKTSNPSHFLVWTSLPIRSSLFSITSLTEVPSNPASPDETSHQEATIDSTATIEAITEKWTFYSFPFSSLQTIKLRTSTNFLHLNLLYPMSVDYSHAAISSRYTCHCNIVRQHR